MLVRGKFHIDVYDCNIHIIISNDILKSIKYYYKKHKDGEPSDAPQGLMYRPGTGDIDNYYIFFDEKFLSNNCINHEKCHAVEYILTDRDIRASGEVRAYLDGCISSKIAAFFKKRNIKITK